MGIFSSVKDFGSSIGVLARLCNKTWDLFDHQERISFFFKTNKKLHCVVNGKSTIITYEFLANSNTLIINYLGIGGASYHLKFLDEYALILVDEGNNEDMCFGNRNSKLELKSSVDIYRLLFSKQVMYLLNNKQQMLDYVAISDVDKVTDGLTDEDKVRCISVFMKYIPNFDVEYTCYLIYYKRKYIPGYIGSFEEGLMSVIEKKYSSYYFDRLYNPRESKAMNLYIERTEDL